MSETIPYADIIILALIAGFILLRLRSVLGQKSSDDESRASYFSRVLPKADKPEPIEPVVMPGDKTRMRPKEDMDAYLTGLPEGDVSTALSAIKARDPLFSATEFLHGARMAFEMVHDAFAKGDKETLSMLLAPDLSKEFIAEIDKRVAQENIDETTLVSVVAKDIVQASLNGNMARLKVHFDSQQIHLVRNPKGDIIEGDVSEHHHVEDEWMFERDVTSKNPNWKIIET